MAIAHPGIALAIGEAWAGPLTAAAGAPVTVELRSWDPVTCLETGIAGRITVNAGQPEMILAPGSPVQVPDHKGTGDRVVKLRWATPDPLRRQTPLVTGYSVYRVTPAAALARGWLAAPPLASALRALAISNPLDAKRLTDEPIQIGKLFSAGDVLNFAGDGITHYLTDDNDRYAANAAGIITGVAFPDGTRHHYFAAGRDLLGREGLVSTAGEGTACARLSPPVPADFALLEEAITNGGAVCQCFTLRWKANAAEGDNSTSAYQIFRGSRADIPQIDLSDLANLPAPIVTLAHAPDANGFMTWRDESLPQGVAGITYWYVLRAVHTSPCPPDNFSGLTPQVYGSLRTATAPPAPATAQAFQCPLAGLRLGLFTAPFEFVTLPAGPHDEQLRTVRLIIERGDPSVERIELKWTWTGYTEPEFSRFDFDPDATQLTADFTVPGSNEYISVAVKSGSIAGSESAILNRTMAIPFSPVPMNIPGWTKDKALVLRGKAAAPALGEISTANADHVAMFSLTAPPVSLTPVAAGLNCFSAVIGGPPHKPYVVQVNRGGWTTVTGAEVSSGKLFFCDDGAAAPPALGSYRAIPINAGLTSCLHYADGADGSIRPVTLRLALPPDFGEYRIYRRVDDGPLALLAQGDGRHLPANAAEVIRQDDGIPATACTLRYFGQTFDKQSQSSPLVPIGDPILLGRRDVSVPILRTPRPGGTVLAPTMRLEWFCPPEGIERFRIRLDPEKPPAPAAVPTLPGYLTAEIVTAARYIPNDHSSLSLSPAYSLFRTATLSTLTSPVGEGQPLGAGPVFSLDLPVTVSTRYTITMQAISVAGVNSGPGKEYVFTWNPPPPPPVIAAEPTVSWPQRRLPDAGFWHPLVRAELTVKAVSGGPPLYERWDIVAPGSFLDYPVGVRIAAQRAKDNTVVNLAVGSPSFNIPAHLIAAVSTQNFAGIPRGFEADISTWLLPRQVTPALLPAGALVAPTVDAALAAGKLSLASTSVGDSLLPAVLYRRQVPSDRFLSVSGATIQVSPMLARIAATQDDGLQIRDPYIGVIARRSSTDPNLVDLVTQSVDLFLLDTQPVTKGARYHYTLLRFSPANGELLESLDAGEVLIP